MTRFVQCMFLRLLVHQFVYLNYHHFHSTIFFSFPWLCAQQSSSSISIFYMIFLQHFIIVIRWWSFTDSNECTFKLINVFFLFTRAIRNQNVLIHSIIQMLTFVQHRKTFFKLKQKFKIFKLKFYDIFAKVHHCHECAKRKTCSLNKIIILLTCMH